MSTSNVQCIQKLEQVPDQSFLERAKNWTGRVIRDLIPTNIQPLVVLKNVSLACTTIFIRKGWREALCKTGLPDEYYHLYCRSIENFSKCEQEISVYDRCMNELKTNNITMPQIIKSLPELTKLGIPLECGTINPLPEFEKYMIPIFCMAFIESQIQPNRYLNDISKYILGSCFAAATAIAAEEDPFAGVRLYLMYKLTNMVFQQIAERFQ